MRKRLQQMIKRTPRGEGTSSAPKKRRLALPRKAARQMTYSNVVATIALFAALSTGTSYAYQMITGAQIKNNSITGKDIKNGKLTGKDLAADTVSSNNIDNGGIGGLDIALDAITGNHLGAGSVGHSEIADGSIDSTDIENGSVNGSDIQNGTIDSTDIENGSVNGSDIQNGTIDGADIENGSVDEADIENGAVTTDDLADSTKDEMVMATVPPGETIRGAWGSIVEVGPDFRYVTFGNSLPVPAPVPLMDDTVNFAASVPLAMDGDATCTGTYENPTAPPGKLCLYLDEWSNPGNTQEARGYASPSGSKFGFYTNFGGSGLTGGWGSWAYRAPLA